MNLVSSNDMFQLYLDDSKQVKLNASIKSKFRIISWVKFLATISGYPLFNTVDLQCCLWNNCKYFFTILIGTVFILNAIVIFSPEFNRCRDIFIVVLLLQVQGLALYIITYFRIMPKLYVSADDNSNSYSSDGKLQSQQTPTLSSKPLLIDGHTVTNDTDHDIGTSTVQSAQNFQNLHCDFMLSKCIINN